VLNPMIATIETKKVERAIFPYNYNIIDDEFLKKVWEEGYTRIYFGAEFCYRLFPTMELVRKKAEILRKRGFSISLVTPYLFQEEFEIFMGNIDELLEILNTDEIIINDLGVLYSLREKRTIKKVAGRAISHISEDQGGEIFFRNFGIERVEGDDISNFEDLNLPLSIYFPYRFMQTTRNCYLVKLDGKCQKQCVNGGFSVKNRVMEEEVFYVGNTGYIIYDSIGNRGVGMREVKIVYEDIKTTQYR